VPVSSPEGAQVDEQMKLQRIEGKESVSMLRRGTAHPRRRCTSPAEIVSYKM
jgi:hypothetical protein